MKILVLIALGALLAGCTSPQPAALESPTQQPTQSQTEATPETTESAADPETDIPAEEVEEQVDQEVATETSSTEAETQETTASSPRATASPTPSATPSPTRTQAAAPTATLTPSPTPTPTPTAAESRLSMANIAKNNSAASCWVAIAGSAYDLTRWIANHPGGSRAISSICGTDATSVFESRHGGQSQPLSVLESYLLGPVGS